MSEEAKLTTVEIGGIKYEVNLTGARKIQQFKVGDRVKVLIKEYTDYKSHAGVIIGIDMFKLLPTVVVAYMPANHYGEAEVKFAYLNAQSKDTEIALMVEDEITPTKDTILQQFDRSISKKLGEVEELKTKREYFLRRFGTTVGQGIQEMSELSGGAV